MQSFLETVRKATLPAIWSQGVKLAREKAVSRVSASPAEITVRVRAPGNAIAPTVTLYIDDGEWSCDCGGKVDPCAHVAAAVIFATQSGAAGATAEHRAQASPRLVYRLGRRDRVLTLRRFVVSPDGREVRLAGSLSSDLARGK